jgi:hypothetical protein
MMVEIDPVALSRQAEEALHRLDALLDSARKSLTEEIGRQGLVSRVLARQSPEEVVYRMEIDPDHPGWMRYGSASSVSVLLTLRRSLSRTGGDLRTASRYGSRVLMQVSELGSFGSALHHLDMLARRETSAPDA